MLETGVMRCGFELRAGGGAVRSALRAKYSDVQMSLARACVVRMAELLREIQF